MSFQKINKCRLCKSAKMTVVLPLESTPIGDDYLKVKNLKQKKFPLKLLRCSNCNFVQLSVNIDANEVYGDYLYVTKTSAGLPEHFKKLIHILEKKKIIYKNSKVLEIGCNDGTLLSFLEKKNCKVLGIDPAVKIVKKLNFKIINDLYDLKLAKKISNKYGDFDTVIANNVIANIDNLDNIFRAISLNLNNNGKFVMETFSLYGLLKNNLLDNIYHEHISYLSIEPLKNFAKKFGLYLKSADHLKVKGGSLRLIFSKSKTTTTEKEKLSKMIYKENLVVKKKASFEKIKKMNIKNNKKIFEFIKKNFDKGHKIYGYGASVGTTTNIYNLKIQKFVEGIFDDEKLRHGLFLPGTNIKVINPKKIKTFKPNIIVIFAWRYVKNILLKKYIPKNTKILIPLPNIKIIG